MKEINKNYLTSELYELKDWIILLEDNYCNEDLANLFDLSSTEDYHSMRIINGGWLVNFDSGKMAYSVLSNWEKTGKLWGFYPDTSEETS